MSEIYIQRRKLVACSAGFMLANSIPQNGEAAVPVIGYLLAKTGIAIAHFFVAAGRTWAATPTGIRLLLPVVGALGAGTAIWVMQNKKNEVEVTVKNNSDDPVMTEFSLAVEDVQTGRIELESNIGNFTARPQGSVNFVASIRNLNSVGKKRLIGRGNNPVVSFQSLNEIVVVDQV